MLGTEYLQGLVGKLEAANAEMKALLECCGAASVLCVHVPQCNGSRGRGRRVYEYCRESRGRQMDDGRYWYSRAADLKYGRGY